MDKRDYVPGISNTDSVHEAHEIHPHHHWDESLVQLPHQSFLGSLVHEDGFGGGILDA